MKLKSFNRETAPSVLSGKPSVRITRKGLFCFNKFSMVQLGLKIGDSIEFHQDEERPKDWYLSKSENGFTYRAYKDGGMVNNVPTALAILNSLDIIPNTTFHIANKPTLVGELELFAILTSSKK